MKCRVQLPAYKSRAAGVKLKKYKGTFNCAYCKNTLVKLCYCFQINIAVQCLSTDFSSQKGVKVGNYLTAMYGIIGRQY